MPRTNNSEDESELGEFGEHGARLREKRSSTRRVMTRLWRACVVITLAALCIVVFVGVVDISFYSGHRLPWHVARHSLPPAVSANVNFDMDPCDNFYDFACGGFSSRVGVPSDREEWALSWDAVESTTREVIHSLVANDTGKAGRFYEACMNVNDIEALGGLPLAPFLKQLQAVSKFGQLIDMMVMLQQADITVLFDWEVVPDPADSSLYVLVLMPGGLTLPIADLYSGNGAHSKHILHVLHGIVRDSLMMSGQTREEAESGAKTCVQTEMMLASMLDTRQDDDTTEGGGPVHHDLESLNKLAPHFEFPKVFAEMVTSGAPLPGTGGRSNIIVHDTSYFKHVSNWLGTLEPEALLPYFRFRLLFALAPLLSPEFGRGNMLLAHQLTGVSESAPRWRMCLDATTRNLPADVGKMYAEHVTSDGRIASAQAMLEDIRQSFRDELAASTSWFSPATRRIAVAKIDNAVFEIGYPSVWDVATFPIHTDSYAANVLRARRHLVSSALSRLSDKTVDRTRWGHIGVMDATTLYSRALNTLFVPAAMLQKPFFSPHYPPARNLGALGAVVAHELSHAVDGGGRNVGPQQEAGDWWSEGDRARYSQRAKCIGHLYDSFHTLVGDVNGTQTLEENIADVTAVTIAYGALEKLLSKSSAPLPLPTSQLFFLSWGQVWCSATRPRLMKLKLETDSHAPEMWRCNGPLTQIPEFARSFGCAGGTEMNPFSRCHLW